MLSSTQLGEYPNIDLEAEEGFLYPDAENYFSYFVNFFGLINIHSYFITTILITNIILIATDIRVVIEVCQKALFLSFM